MDKRLVLFVALGLLLVTSFRLSGLDQPGNKEVTHFTSFVNFVQKYNKQYDAVSFEEKYNIFKENVQRVEQLNAKSPNKVFGVTKFMDMTPEEFRKAYLMPKGLLKKGSKGSVEDVLVPNLKGSVPDTFDWRTQGAVTPVKNQGQCGSCWAFSVTENVESVWIISTNASVDDIDLSPQQIVDCDTDDGGCDGGDTPTAYNYIIKAGGLESEKSYPYHARDGRCNFKKTLVVAKIKSYKYATQHSNENTMQQNLVSWAPLSICVDASQWQFYDGGVMSSSDCGDDLDHCTQMIGYANDKGKYWIVRNSWGTDWGVEGYIYLQMGGDTCGCADEATTAVA
jgi:cathepsin F